MRNNFLLSLNLFSVQQHHSLSHYFVADYYSSLKSSDLAFINSTSSNLILYVLVVEAAHEVHKNESKLNVLHFYLKRKCSQSSKIIHHKESVYCQMSHPTRTR